MVSKTWIADIKRFLEFIGEIVKENVRVFPDWVFIFVEARLKETSSVVVDLESRVEVAVKIDRAKVVAG